MPVSADHFRDALRLFAAGVTLVTTRRGERIHGLTVSAFASVSTDPPLISVMIDHKHTMHPLLEDGTAPFAVNILGHEQEELSNRFAFKPEAERFQEGNWGQAVTGAPILEDALAWLDCTVFARHPAGSHSMYIGEVQAAHSADPERNPLIYWNRGYRQLSS